MEVKYREFIDLMKRIQVLPDILNKLKMMAGESKIISINGKIGSKNLLFQRNLKISVGGSENTK